MIAFAAAMAPGIAPDSRKIFPKLALDGTKQKAPAGAHGTEGIANSNG
jgi:hypothetical protein